MYGLKYITMANFGSNSIKFFAIATATIGFGAALGWVSLSTGYAWGWLGALVLVGWALLARHRWQSLHESDLSVPGPAERVAWQRLVGYFVIFGHMAFSFFNPHIDIHLGAGNYLAIDNWTVVFGMAFSSMLFRADSQERDERDARISALAMLWAFRTLIVLLVALLSFIGFMPHSLRELFNHFIVANLIVGAMLLSLISGQTTRVYCYARDHLVIT
jgi:hypothetical protein